MRSATRLEVDVALVPIACASESCARVVPIADAVYFRKIPGTACAEPLCAACGASALEDMRLTVRLALHAAEQARDDWSAPGEAYVTDVRRTLGGEDEPDDEEPDEPA